MIDTWYFKFETRNYLNIEDSTELDSPGSNTLSWFLLYIVGLACTIAIVATMKRRKRIPEIRDMIARTDESFSLGCVTGPIVGSKVARLPGLAMFGPALRGAKTKEVKTLATSGESRG